MASILFREIQCLMAREDSPREHVVAKLTRLAEMQNTVILEQQEAREYTRTLFACLRSSDQGIRSSAQKVRTRWKLSLRTSIGKDNDTTRQIPEYDVIKMDLFPKLVQMAAEPIMDTATTTAVLDGLAAASLRNRATWTNAEITLFAKALRLCARSPDRQIQRAARQVRDRWLSKMRKRE